MSVTWHRNLVAMPIEGKKRKANAPGRRVISTAKAFENGQNAAMRGASRSQCFYSDQKMLSSWEDGYDSFKKNKKKVGK